MKTINGIFSICLIMLLFAACENSSEMSENTFAEAAEEAEFKSEEVSDNDLGVESNIASYKGTTNNANNGTSSGFSNRGNVAQEPIKKADKIIKKGNIGIELKNYQKDKHYVEDLIRKYDAYKSNENERNESNRISNTIEIRLPSKHFEAFMDEVTKGKGIVNIDYKRTSATDVGEEYSDLQTRIKTKKEVEKRYIEILRKATTIPDILQVENQIRVIREEIESKEGRLKYFKDRVSYSTINLYVYQELEYNAPPTDKPSFWGKLGNAVISGWNGVLAIILGLVHIWPFVLLVIGAIVIIRRRMFFFKKRS